MTASDLSTEPVRLETVDDVACIVLARPQALNALNVEMLSGLIAAIERSRDAAALVLYGEGRAFCVGEDLRETLAPLTGTTEEFRASFEMLQHLTRLLTGLPLPVVVAVHGYAIGGGAELALAGDLVIAGRDLRLRFPEVPIGHSVTGGITARLAATVGLLRAKELLLTGRWVGADEAARLGMATEVVDDPIKRAKQLGQELGAMPRSSMGATKIGVETASIPHQEPVLNAEIGAALYCFADDASAGAYEPFQQDGKSEEK